MHKNFLINFIFIFLLVPLLHSEGNKYFQQDVRYEIDVTLDDKNHSLSGFEKIDYTNNSNDTLDFIWFHLWPNAYKNDSTAFAKQQIRIKRLRFANSKEKDRGYIDSLSFRVDGQESDVEIHADWIDVVKIILPKKLLPGKSILIETPFYVKLPLVFSRLGHSGQHYEITQWYPKPAVYDNKGWHEMPYLNMGEFYSEFGTFDVKITLPEEYRIMATGDLVNGEDELYWLDSLASLGDSLHMLSKKEFKNKLKLIKNTSNNQNDSDSLITRTKTVHFRQKNVHDFAWFADKNWIVRTGNLYLSDSTKKITLWSFYLPKNAQLWENSIEYLHDSGYWYSKFYGDYPYNHLTAVDGDLSAGGGMEYPNITVISSGGSQDLLEYVIMHEVGHNWFYGIIGSNERDHTWMDEGLNQYSNIRYWQKKYKYKNEQIRIQDFIQDKLGIGKNLSMSWVNYAGYVSNGKNKDAQPLSLTADAYSRGNYGQHYSKTAVFMRFLEHYLGENKIDIIFKDFFQKWKFKHPYPEDLEEIFNIHSDENLDWFFDNVFEKTTYIDYGVNNLSNRFILSNYGTFSSPVEVAYYNKKGQEIKREWLHGIKSKKMLNAPPGTLSIKIDPDEHMPDINRSNNGSPKNFEFKLIWDKPNYFNHVINIIPWPFFYNYYNGFSPGITMFSGFLPGYDGNGNTASLLYDFEHNKPIGNLSLTRSLNEISIFHESSFSFRFDHSSGRTGMNANFSAIFKEPLMDDAIAQLNANLFYHILDSYALDPFLYDGGKYIIGSILYNKNWEVKNNSSLVFNSGLKMGKAFYQGFFSASVEHRFTKKIITKIKVYLSDYFFKKDLPAQYRTYLSGSIDPDFQNNIIDRTGKSKNVKVLSNMFYNVGPGLRGLVLAKNEYPLVTEKRAWSFSVDQKFPFIPGKIFMDIGGISESQNLYIVSGFHLGPLLIPFYQSWEIDNKMPNKMDWVLNRFRFSLDLNLPIRFIF